METCHYSNFNDILLIYFSMAVIIYTIYTISTSFTTIFIPVKQKISHKLEYLRDIQVGFT